MIVVKLRKAMEEYRKRSDEGLTYAILAERAGISYATLESLASRPRYNTRLSTIDRLCQVLSCQQGDLLEIREKRDRKSCHAN